MTSFQYIYHMRQLLKEFLHNYYYIADMDRMQRYQILLHVRHLRGIITDMEERLREDSIRDSVPVAETVRVKS